MQTRSHNILYIMYKWYLFQVHIVQLEAMHLLPVLLANIVMLPTLSPQPTTVPQDISVTAVSLARIQGSAV